MIKIGTRPNLCYPMMFVIFNSLRKIDSIIMKKYFDFSCDTLFIFLMFFADFFIRIKFYHLFKENYFTFMNINI